MKHLIFLTGKSPSTLNSISQPKDFPIQFFCIVFTLFGQLSSFSNLRNLKNKRYPIWRIDTYFSKIKQIDLKIIDNGGWHFTNLKTPEDLFNKLNNFGHHDEFELTNLTINKLKEKIKNKEVFYDHFADKKTKSKWNSDYKLKKIDDNLLPQYLIHNKIKFKDWFEK